MRGILISMGGRAGGQLAPAAPTFEIADRLDHHDESYSSILVGDANHNGRQEFVI